MKIIRWWGVAAFLITALLLTIVWYFVVPMVVKSSIEETGSEVLGAKLDIAQIKVHLFPLGVTINGIAATNPDEPMSNIVEIDTVTFAVDSSKLLWKKVLIDELKIDGVQLDTERKVNGSIDPSRRLTAVSDRIINNISSNLSELTQDDIKQIVADADLVTLKNLTKLDESQKTLKTFWEKELQNTQHEKNLKAIEIEFSRLSKRAKNNSINLITDRKSWKKLKKDIKKERESISALNKKLKSDKNDLALQIENVKNSPKIDLDNILSKTGLNDGLSGMSKKMVDQLIGPQFTPWIEKFITFVQHTKNAGKNQSEENAPIHQTAKGMKVQFKDEQLFPQVLINKLSLSGKDKKWISSGTGNNLAYFPWVIAKPADLSIDFNSVNGKSNASASIVSDWESTQKMKTQLQSKIKDWNIESIKLIENKQGSWIVNSGVLNGTLVGDLTLDTINLDMSFSINDASITSPEGLSGWQKNLTTSLSKQKLISISVKARGDLTDPKISINTNLEKLISSALGDSLKENISKQKEEIQRQISERVGDLSKLDNLNNDFEEWTEKLKNNDSLLKKLKVSF